MNIDFWYGHTLADVTGADCFFYPNNGEYRGNVYKDGRIIGDYTATDSTEIEKTLPVKF